MSNQKELTPEMLEKAKSAMSAAALLTLAQENGITLTPEEAATYFAKLHPKAGALSDAELDDVAGGGFCDKYDPTMCPKCHRPEIDISHITRRCKNCGYTEYKHINI